MARRKTFQEAMELVPLPAASPNPNSTSGASSLTNPDGSSNVTRYMSRRPAWLPGADLRAEIDDLGRGRPGFPVHEATFGGHVYAQSVLAVCQTLEQDTAAAQAAGRRFDVSALGLHTIHGYFTAAGKPDRPFVYEVAVLTRGRSFVTARVEARQPLAPSSQAPAKVQAQAQTGRAVPEDDTDFRGDAAGDGPLGVVCFTAIVSFVTPRPHSFGANCQEAPVQQRFAAVLGERAPAAWAPSPPVDIDVLLEVLGRRDVVGTFPMVDMKKVDMTRYNDGRPLADRRELILYRLLAPLPRATAAECNAHVLVHAYAADRNGLLMTANNLEFPLNDKVASLSNTFVVHTNVAAAAMTYHPPAASDNDLAAGWWIQEVCFPRAGAGRAIILNKIWSPEGVHVATEYQDGLCIAQEKMPFDWKL
ncbi:hypothetical protein HMPREF1624_05649 [Sporothrix schenckii ATCC 58251]|uniref:Acyl-CoA thioesterase-like N-terminal HotDog domain-containing protein n=1 Tax=Sporothrix schenckii (strain ATCC 58251 / de Perez 2211183) TaxID=1391915 RepID=U7PRD2_SPOS1|nr:hypothetical protein HMPREF1624_05649 [Sporothrix schenckii ATCC 58251]